MTIFTIAIKTTFFHEEHLYFYVYDVNKRICTYLFIDKEMQTTPTEQIPTYTGTMYILMKQKLARAEQYICVKKDTSCRLYTTLGAIIV